MSRAHLYAPPRPRSLRMPLLLLAAVGSILLLAAAYHIGRVDGSAAARSAARAEQLRANQVELAALTPQLQEATRAKVATTARVGVAQKHYDTARSRVQLVDSSHVAIDAGPAIELPAPVITTIARADTLVPELRAQVIAANAWGEVWKKKAELLEQRVGLLEGQLADERSSRRSGLAKAVAIGAAVGGLLVEVIR